MPPAAPPAPPLPTPPPPPAPPAPPPPWVSSDAGTLGEESESIDATLKLLSVVDRVVLVARSGFGAALRKKEEGRQLTLTLRRVATPRYSVDAAGLDVQMLDALLAPIDAPFATPTLAVAPNAFANGSSVAIDDSRVLATTTLRLRLVAHNPVPADGSVRLALPLGFDTSLGTWDFGTWMAGGAGRRWTGTSLAAAPFDGAVELKVRSRARVALANTTVTATRTTLELHRRGGGAPSAPGAVLELAFPQLLNPPYAHATASARASTHDGEGREIDTLDTGLALAIAPHVLSDATVALAGLRAGAQAAGELSVTLRNPFAAGAVLELAFPPYFTLPAPIAAACATVEVVGDAAAAAAADAPPCGTLLSGALSEALNVSAHERAADGRPLLRLTRPPGGAPIAGGSRLRVRFADVTAPCAEQTTMPFGVRTEEVGLGTVDLLADDDGANASVAPAIPSVAVAVGASELTAASVAFADGRAHALTTATISFTAFNAVPARGAVVIRFPPQFSFFGAASGWGFGGSVEAESAALGWGLVVKPSGGGAGARDDHVLRVVRTTAEAAPPSGRCAAPGATTQKEIVLRLTNVQLPAAAGPTGYFNLSTQTAEGETVDVLRTPLRVTIAPAEADEEDDGDDESAAPPRAALASACAAAAVLATAAARRRGRFD